MFTLESLRYDLRYAARALRTAPGYTFAVIITLAIGIGASTAIFSMVNGVLLRRLPVGVGNRLVHITQPSAQSEDDGFSVLEVKDLNEQVRTMSAVAEYHSMFFQLYGHGDPLRVQTGVVSDRFFTMLGVKPLLGRTFVPGEDAVGAPPVVVLSYKFWMDQFFGDPSIVGATFTMNDKIHRVVGVLPPLPSYPNENDIWMPAGACPFRSSPMMMNTRDHRMVGAFAVLKPGMTLERAQAEVAALSARFHGAYPADYPAQQRLHFALIDARDEMTNRAKPILYLLFATAGFLLLAAMANVANLSLARQLRRAREMALRVALGADQARLYRQLSFESLVLALAGGGLGVALATSGIGMLRSIATRLTPRADEIHIDATALAFALALSLVIALAVAAVPFLRVLRQNRFAAALRQGNTASVGSRGDLRMRNMLVVGQVAIAFVMLVGAGLIGRSLFELERVDAGIDVHNVLTAQLSFNFSRYNTGAKVSAVDEALLRRVDGLPSVSSVAMASTLPLNGAQQTQLSFEIEGIAPSSGVQLPHAEAIAISPGYFRTVGIPLLRGRDFTLADRDTLAPPVLLGARLVQTYWGGHDPIGTRISPDSGKHWLTVIGVVGDVRQRRLDADITDEIYAPMLGSPTGNVRIFLRTLGPRPAILAALRAAVRDVDAQTPISNVQTLEEIRGAQLAEPRLTTTLIAAFAAFALLLTATGLAGVIGYSVTQRLPEIAVRMALGADAPRVLRLVMRQGLAIVVIGVVVGCGVALLASRLVTNLLFHVQPTDAATYSLVAGVLLLAASASCWLPSRRALRVDPAQLLRAGG
ncbi:MAG TPA: ABC transporter permease [Gemmatimonadaceae bacterium]|jgi:predicted permease